jgi:hypothetical protein
MTAGEQIPNNHGPESTSGLEPIQKLLKKIKKYSGLWR